MEVIGEVIVVGETVSVGANGFTKRLLVIQTEGKYPQKIPIDFVKDNDKLLNNTTVGQKVKVAINLKGSEGNGKWYLNAQGWKIEEVI